MLGVATFCQKSAAKSLQKMEPTSDVIDRDEAAAARRLLALDKVGPPGAVQDCVVQRVTSGQVNSKS